MALLRVVVIVVMVVVVMVVMVTMVVAVDDPPMSCASTFDIGINATVSSPTDI